jgi:malate synthase
MGTLEKPSIKINQEFYNFINQEVLSVTKHKKARFWDDVVALVKELVPENRRLLAERDDLQTRIDVWLQENKEDFNQQEYTAFLREIGYLEEEGGDFQITTSNVDPEIAELAGPQLVVPLKNARFALNAANSRWGSLYDAIYGSDLIVQDGDLAAGGDYNTKRGELVVEKSKDFLDDIFPLAKGSHKDAICYLSYYQQLLVYMEDGSSCGLKNPKQFVGINGPKDSPESILLRNNGLHVELCFDKSGSVGSRDKAGIEDIAIEAALTTIMDCEDSVCAVDPEDKIEVYRNWLGLMQGTLTETFEKDGQTICRRLKCNRMFTGKDGEEFRVKGRSLMMIRNVGHLMTSSLILDDDGNETPEGIIDAIVTILIATIDIAKEDNAPKRNSRARSIYVVKPKMHGPKEVAFTCKMFARVEELLGLELNTVKLGIMDEERRTTVNLKECIRAAKDRVCFINTGFLDRTGDEIHTSMHAGPFLPKGEMKQQPWIQAYENWNVDIGLECGFQGKAQIGKGMWAMPSEMARMMDEKMAHPASGANTAWVPSPTAAALHAMHYHYVDVFEKQNKIKDRARADLNDILNIPILPIARSLTENEISNELENSIQGILGYVVRWVDLGIGCSTVPDIHDIGLMEDRATLRISSQLIANWLHHGICNPEQVMNIMQRMAEVVDAQNAKTKGYQPMSGRLDESYSFQAAKALIFEGCNQTNGYTEPLLHSYRLRHKAR